MARSTTPLPAVGAVGVGIVADLSAVETRPADPGPVRVRTTVPGVPTSWQTSDLALPAPYVGALAHASAAPGARLHTYGR
ncbi:hypothetical protein ACFWUZ_13480 [Streptomyces sp. NPDC058646]|uniref:hypothetical protein n=1 Tax=Streptomyces sp. NPDC058646 TaxID=3346574 RepID=UPI003646D834